jgi:hypothetical protein
MKLFCSDRGVPGPEIREMHQNKVPTSHSSGRDEVKFGSGLLIMASTVSAQLCGSFMIRSEMALLKPLN